MQAQATPYTKPTRTTAQTLPMWAETKRKKEFDLEGLKKEDLEGLKKEDLKHNKLKKLKRQRNIVKMKEQPRNT